ncbi:MAG TPA: hypothetical protein VFI95_24235 [Terriglobales bacterium]|nr:hypothetical protein [Terriglobales bacterium]
MAAKAADLDVVPAMAILAVGHLHALMLSKANAKNRTTPDVPAVSADSVLFVDSHLVGLTIGGMAISTSQATPLSVDRMRKPDVRRLFRVDQPWHFLSRLDVVVDQNGFVFTRADPLRVAGCTGF